MSRFGIICGLILCADTAFALFGSTAKLPLFFIPMMIGIPMLFFGVVALNPHRRRHSLALTAGLAAIGLLVGTGNLSHSLTLWGGGNDVNLHHARIVSVMVGTCVAFLAGYIWSAFFRLRVTEASPGVAEPDPPA